MRYFFLLILFSPIFAREYFMYSQDDVKKYASDQNVIMVSSPGRSGSTLVRNVIRDNFPDRIVLKSHLLPPKVEWKGKILYIFSNPDQAAESIFHLSFDDPTFVQFHFDNVETADMRWLKKLKVQAESDEATVFMNLHQNFKNNLLSYDALGTKRHLMQWLVRSVEKAPMEASNVMAVKYENLWDKEVVEAIKKFCGLESFPLPPKKSRGYRDHLAHKEQLIRTTYNLGTESDPHYAAYVGARAIWEKAPKFQTYKLKH